MSEKSVPQCWRLRKCRPRSLLEKVQALAARSSLFSRAGSDFDGACLRHLDTTTALSAAARAIPETSQRRREKDGLSD